MICFHDYTLLRGLNEQHPGIVTFSDGNVIFNEGWFNNLLGKKEVEPTNQPGEMPWWLKKREPSFRDAERDDYLNKIPAFRQPPPLPQHRPGTRSVDTAPISSEHPWLPDGEVHSADAIANLPQAPYNASPDAIRTGTHPEFKADYQALLGVYNSIKTPQLKNMMKAWLSKAFVKTPRMDMSPVTGMAGSNVGSGSVDTWERRPSVGSAATSFPKISRRTNAGRALNRELGSNTAYA